MKAAGQILADIVEQTITPAIVTFFEGVKIDICGSLLCLFSAYAKLTLHIVRFTHHVVFCVTAFFVFSSNAFCSIIALFI